MVQASGKERAVEPFRHKLVAATGGVVEARTLTPPETFAGPDENPKISLLYREFERNFLHFLTPFHRPHSSIHAQAGPGLYLS
jgi:hypothetical protein